MCTTNTDEVREWFVEAVNKGRVVHITTTGLRRYFAVAMFLAVPLDADDPEGPATVGALDYVRRGGQPAQLTFQVITTHCAARERVRFIEQLWDEHLHPLRKQNVVIDDVLMRGLAAANVGFLPDIARFQGMCAYGIGTTHEPHMRALLMAAHGWLQCVISDTLLATERMFPIG